MTVCRIVVRTRPTRLFSLSDGGGGLCGCRSHSSGQSGMRVSHGLLDVTREKTIIIDLSHGGPRPSLFVLFVVFFVFVFSHDE